MIELGKESEMRVSHGSSYRLDMAANGEGSIQVGDACLELVVRKLNCVEGEKEMCGTGRSEVRVWLEERPVWTLENLE